MNEQTNESGEIPNFESKDASDGTLQLSSDPKRKSYERMKTEQSI